MTFDLSTFLAVAVPLVGVVVWMVRLEGRINVHDARYGDILRQLVRIETKLDRMNGRP